MNNEDLDKWVHTPAKWHHLKYRGGTFEYHRIWDESNQHLPQHVGDAVTWALALVKEGRAHWQIAAVDGNYSNDLEVHRIRFKRANDAVTFRLMFS